MDQDQRNVPDRGVDEFLASHDYSDSTKDNYQRIFGRILTDRDETLTAAGLVKRIKSQKGWGNSQQCVAVNACRKFLRWRYGTSHPALGARIKVEDSKPQRTLMPQKALELLMSFDASNPKGARDLALAALLLDTGLRASEICRLQLADCDLEQKLLTVLVKGGKWEFAVFSDRTAEWISAWVAVRIANPGVGALFVNIKQGTQLTRDGLKCLMRDWGAAIGIALSPHDFRRSYATIASIFGGPTRLVQIGGRWHDIAMVERYTRALQLDAVRPYLPVANLIR
jgi:site-specific recombinase XerC